MKELGREIKEGRSDCLTRFKRSEASNLHAEVFLEELQYVLDEEVLEKLVVHPQGMNPRVKEVISSSWSEGTSMVWGRP